MNLHFICKQLQYKLQIFSHASDFPESLKQVSKKVVYSHVKTMTQQWKDAYWASKESP